MGREGGSPSGLEQAGEETMLSWKCRGQWQKFLDPALQGIERRAERPGTRDPEARVFDNSVDDDDSKHFHRA